MITLKIKVPDETTGISMTVIATNCENGSTIYPTAFAPEEPTIIEWKNNNKHWEMTTRKEI